MNRIFSIIIAIFSGIAFIEGDYLLSVVIIIAATLFAFDYFDVDMEEEDEH